MAQPRPMREEYTRAADFMEHYRKEAQRMKQPPQTKAKPSPVPSNDAAVILPILLLLMTEGADKFLLFALLYILM